MMENKAATLINQQNGELAFKVFPFSSDDHFDHIQRHNYYSIILIYKGDVELQVELEKYAIPPKVIICISPYQPYSIKLSGEVAGVTLNFHSDFFCTYKHQSEIQTEGVLFHNVFQPTFFSCSDEKPLLLLLDQMKSEIRQDFIGQHQQLVSYLKIFLLSILRIKHSCSLSQENNFNSPPEMMQNLIENIETHFRQKHSAIDYAEMFNVSTSSLAKMVRKYFGKTLTKLLAERILVEAKRELYLTSKSVKEISFLLGYQDEHYFSRFFKKHAGISPSVYRSTVGFAKLEQ